MKLYIYAILGMSLVFSADASMMAGLQDFRPSQEVKDRQRHEKKRHWWPTAFLQLPTNLASKAVYHVKTRPVYEFCCGPNVLYNACNLEEWCDFPNCYSSHTIFRERCKEYFDKEGINQEDGVSLSALDFLAVNGLELQPFFILAGWDYERGCFDNQVVNIDPKADKLIAIESVIIAEPAASQVETDNLRHALRVSLEDEQLMSIKTRLDTSRKNYEVTHFCCYFKWEKANDYGDAAHVILISLVQNNTGRGLYIFDNLNEKIDESSPAKRFIDFLCDRFEISPKSEFSGPGLPSQWPSLPQS